MILNDLDLPKESDCPDSLRTTLVTLVEKGLELAKDIVNDDPPGELSIENQGTLFNPEIHQPVPGCEASGRIVYTTYPSYQVKQRILGEALKAWVFTVSEEKWESLKTESNPQSKQVGTDNSADSAGSDNNKPSHLSANPSDGTTDLPDEMQKLSSPSEQVKNLKALGKTDYELAKELGVCEGTIKNWETGQSTPLPDNQEKLNRLYDAVLCRSNFAGKENKSLFKGKVCKSEGIFFYKSRKTSDTEYGEKKKYDQVLTFDDRQEGETVQDLITFTTENVWFRVAGTDYWVPSLYIKLESSNQPTIRQF